ncbi:IclR family transcriptional regulator [Brachybacterium sp. GCM10030252]|uniref:IclR family transcriptional regulator n=1 Tax=Brachybacterium sp. GCM10030252 TaxID=3273380 RepID=UPI003614F671
MPEPKDPAPAVSRALRLLEVLSEAQGEPMSLAALSRAVGIAKSSASNICAVLEDGRMIHRADGGYRLGMRTAELGGAFAAQFNQVREFFGVVESMPELAHEVVQIAVLDGTDALYLARHEGRRERLGTPIGSRLPLVYTAAGNALLMALADDEVEDILRAEHFAPKTPRSVRAPQEAWEKIRAARERGFAVDRGESLDAVYGVAAPLPAWRPGDPQMALGVALPREETDYTTVERVGAAVVDAARQLTNPLAARP